MNPSVILSVAMVLLLLPLAANGRSEKAEALLFASERSCRTYTFCASQLVEEHRNEITNGDLARLSREFEEERMAQRRSMEFFGRLPEYSSIEVAPTRLNWSKMAYEVSGEAAEGYAKTRSPWGAVAFGLAAAADESAEQYFQEQDRIEDQKFTKKLVDDAVGAIQGGQRRLLGNQQKLLDVSLSVESELKEQTEAITQLGAQLSKAKSERAELSQDAQANHEKIEALSFEILDKEKQVLALTAGIAEDVTFLKQETFASLSPERQLAALKSKAFGDPAENSGVALKIAQLEFKTSFDAVTRDTNRTLQLASQLGLDLPDEVAWAANALTTGNAVYAALSGGSPDIIGAALSLTGLFGKRTDVQFERYKNIMKKLERIEGQLDDIIETQKEILAGQRRILLTIGKLSEQVEKSTQVIVSTIAKQHGLTRQTVIDFGIEGMVQCGVFRSRVVAIENGESADAYVDFSRVYRDFSDEFLACHQGIKAQLTPLGSGATPVSPAFLMNPSDSDEKNDLWSRSFRDQVFAPVVSYFEEKGFRPGGSLAPLVSLFFPVSTLEGVGKALEIAESGDGPEVIGINRDRYDGALSLSLVRGRLIDPERTVSLLEPLRDIHFIYSFFEEAAHISIGKIAATRDEVPREGLSEVGQEHLRDAVALTNLAIAQQNLLAGHLLLASMYDDVASGDSKRTRRALAVASTTPELTENFSRYFVYRRMGADPSVAARYSFAIGTGSVAAVAQALGSETLGEVECKKRKSDGTCDSEYRSGFRLVFSDAPDILGIDLPHPIVIEDGRLVSSRWLQQLLQLRSALSGELAGYTLLRVKDSLFARVLATLPFGSVFGRSDSVSTVATSPALSDFYLMSIASEMGSIH